MVPYSSQLTGASNYNVAIITTPSDHPTGCDCYSCAAGYFVRRTAEIFSPLVATAQRMVESLRKLAEELGFTPKEAEGASLLRSSFTRGASCTAMLGAREAEAPTDPNARPV